MTYLEVCNAIQAMVDAGTFNYIDYIKLVDMNIWSSLMYWTCYAIACSFVILPSFCLGKKIVEIIKDVKYEIEEGEMNY